MCVVEFPHHQLIDVLRQGLSLPRNTNTNVNKIDTRQREIITISIRNQSTDQRWPIFTWRKLFFALCMDIIFWCGYIDSDKPHKHLNMLLFMILLISVWIICSFSFDFSFETCWGVRNSGWVLKQTEIKVFQWWNQSVNVVVQQSVEAENKQWGNICNKLYIEPSLKKHPVHIHQCNLQLVHSESPLLWSSYWINESFCRRSFRQGGAKAVPSRSTPY